MTNPEPLPPRRSRPQRGVVELSPVQRARYVRWWIESSGLSPAELREIATGLWSDRVFDDRARSQPASEAA